MDKLIDKTEKEYNDLREDLKPKEQEVRKLLDKGKSEQQVSSGPLGASRENKTATHKTVSSSCATDGRSAARSSRRRQSSGRGGGEEGPGDVQGGSGHPGQPQRYPSVRRSPVSVRAALLVRSKQDN